MIDTIIIHHNKLNFGNNFFVPLDTCKDHWRMCIECRPYPKKVYIVSRLSNVGNNEQVNHWSDFNKLFLQRLHSYIK